MRIKAQSQSIEATNLVNIVKSNVSKESVDEQPQEQVISKGQLHQAVSSINEIFEISHRELKFEFHEGLEEYFVQLVNSETKEVVKEIPSKKLLDTFYEMQKLVGLIVDEKI